jgi:acyl-CoA thioesterase-1
VRGDTPGCRPRRRAGVVVQIALLGASCTAGRANRTGPSSTPNAAAARLYVAIGASETRGVGTDEPIREAWPQVLFRTLPANYRLVNLAVPDATLADALDEELPTAESLHPALVTVWLNSNDVFSGVPTATYRSELSSLVHRLRATGAAVLVANTPPLDDLPGYLACLDPAAQPDACPTLVSRPVPSSRQVVTAVEAYNIAISAVVAQEGAVLVDLHRSGLATRALGQGASLVSSDGLNPDAAGSAMIASQFAAVVPK